MQLPLTQRDEQGCLNIVSGMSATDSLLNAGFGRFSPTHSTRWLKRAKITERINQLRKEATNAVIAPLRERKERLTKVLRHEPTEITTSHVLQAVDLLAKLEGDYKPEDIPIGDITIRLVRESPPILEDVTLIDKPQDNNDGRE